jgi:hypothetical protein
MKIELSDLSGLPEGLKSVVESEGDKHAIDLSKLMVAEDLTGLKTALQRERENVSAYSKLGKPDDIAKRIADLEEKAKGTGKGAAEAQEKLDAMKAEYETKLADSEKRFRSVLERQAVSDLKAELAKAGVVPEGLDLMAAYARQRIEFADDGTVKVLTADGKPMIGSGADHGATLSDLATELAKSIPHLVADKGAGGSGKQPGSNGGKPEPKTVQRGEWDKMNHAERTEFSKSGGKVVDD